MLTQYTDLQGLGNQLQANAQRADDLLISSKRMQLKAMPFKDEATAETILKPQLYLPELDTSYDISKHAHSSLASLAGIPSQFYKKLKAEQLGLLEMNVNTLLKNVEPEAIKMTRTFKPTTTEQGLVRNIMSDSYYRLDNWEVARVILEALQDDIQAQNIEFRSLALTDELMHIKITKKNLRADLRQGDPVEIGIAVRNSDIGRSSFTISPLVYRLVCTNGMIAEDNKYSRMHRTGKSNNHKSLLNEHQLSNETKSLHDQAMLSEVKDHINHFLTEDFMEKQVSTMKASMGEKLEQPEKTIEALSQRFGYSEALQKDIFHDLLQSNDLTKFGVSQSITQVAHQSKNVTGYNQSTQLEQDGFSIFSMDLSKLVVNV